MGFLDNYKLALFENDTDTPDAKDFRARVQMALVKTAILVAGEGKSDMTETTWEKRGRHAAEVLRNPTAWIDQYALAVAANPAITAASADTDVEFTIVSVFSDLAGVSGRDMQ
jgi:hypothetical protein